MPVEPGSFEMGSDSSGAEDCEQPVHTVHITKPFWMGSYPVTQAEYKYKGLTGGHNPSYFEGDRNPVERVNWHKAAEFCRKLTGREREAGRLPGGYEYRLPTEAEWEYAARGGGKSKGYKYAGSDNIDSVALYDKNGGTHPVGKLAPNELGLHDMSGNVEEWCLDWYDDDCYGKTKGAKDPVNNVKDDCRVLRGGSWGSFARRCRSAYRNYFPPDITSCNYGFRVVLGVSR